MNFQANIPESLQESLRRLERAWQKSNHAGAQGVEPVYAIDWGSGHIITGEILTPDTMPDHLDGLKAVNSTPSTFFSKVKAGLRDFFYEEVNSRPSDADPVCLDHGAIAFPPGYPLCNAPHMKQV